MADEAKDEAPIDDDWEEFRFEDQDPIGINDLKSFDLSAMPEDVCVHILDDYFPDTTITRRGEP